MLQCKICFKNYYHLGSHIAHGHKILAIEYKEMFGLDHKTALITEEIKEKKHEAFMENYDKYISNLEKGKKYQFKKGKTYVMGYVSAQQKKRQLALLTKINKKRKILQSCPICNMKYNHVESHLYNKHKLIKAP